MKKSQNDKDNYQMQSAEEKYPEIFDSLNLIINQIHHWVHGEKIPEIKTYWGVVRMGLLLRAFNQYKSIINLLRTNHWEDALILTRSLFELLLYTEELLRSPDVEKAAHRFWLFSELQRYLEWREITLYEVLTGRRDSKIELEIKKNLDKKVRKFFSIFWHVNKKGRGKWRESWCNKNRAALSKDSTNPMRIHQYYFIYGRGSDFTHSSPIAVFSASHQMEMGHSFQDFKDRSDFVEENELRKVASISSLFLLEVFQLVGDRLPEFDPQWIVNTLESIKKMQFS